MYADCLPMTVNDRLALAPIEHLPIPVIYSPDNDGEWLIRTTEYGLYNLRPIRDWVRCDCHDLLWHHSELTVLDGDPLNRLTCDLP